MGGHSGSALGERGQVGVRRATCGGVRHRTANGGADRTLTKDEE